MSRIEKKIYKEVIIPTSKQQSYGLPAQSYKGFSTTSPSKTSTKVYDLECIRQDIINHFHIRQGEKLSDPEFGTIIWDVLFDPLTDRLREAIADDVTEIINYDPRVNADKIVVDSYEHGIQISCNLTYVPYDISEYLQLRFDSRAGYLIPTTKDYTDQRTY